MLPRLVLMHCVLRDSGVAVISIDDNEYSQLKVLMDHVFGHENCLGTLIVNRSRNGKGSKNHIATNHEYVLVYGKTKKATLRGLPEQDDASYDKADQHGKYKIDGLFRKKGDASKRSDRPNMFYPLYYDLQGNVYAEDPSGKLPHALPIDSKGVERRWLWSIEKVRNESWRLYASPRGIIYVKNYLTPTKRIKVRSVWDDNRYLTDRATNEIVELFGDKIFETPKPLGLIEDLIDCGTHEDALILDFFAGTGTTAHAARNLNERDGGSRKVILIEQNAYIANTHPAWSLGYKRIPDITKQRLDILRRLDPDYSYEIIETE